MKQTSRSAIILAALMREYIRTGEPVSSQDLVEKYDLGVSPATVRNEMASLEKSGYLRRPHISSGRVPTDQGYRFFVQELMNRFELGEKERNHLKRELLLLQKQHEELGKSLSRLLAETTGQAAFTLLPQTVSTAGVSNLVNDQSNPKEIKEVLGFLDSLDEQAPRLIKNYFQERPEIYIGKEIKLAETSDYTLIVRGITLASGEKGIIGVVGPKRMRYNKNLSVIEYLAKLLGSHWTGMVILALCISKI